MHRKSMEAAQTLTNDLMRDKKDGIKPAAADDDSSGADDSDDEDTKPNPDNKDDFRSNSIAALRAKAQEHSARLFAEGHKLFSMGGGEGRGEGAVSHARQHALAHELVAQVRQAKQGSQVREHMQTSAITIMILQGPVLPLTSNIRQ